jgi:SAM-dependent methyltransferase
MLGKNALRLLDKDHLIVTGPVDKAKWNYSPILSLLQRARFRLILQLIGAKRRESLLEIGYGSGVFFPELRRRSSHLFGVDIHPYPDKVQSTLASVGINAKLYSASAENIPLESQSMDLIVSVSALEYVPDKPKAASELHRVLRPLGQLAIVYPLANVILDAGLTLLTGESATQYGDGRETLLPALCEQFSIVSRIHFPSWVPRALRIYEAVLLTVRK